MGENYPINFDFGANWGNLIVPYLEHINVKRAITIGVREYLSDFPKSPKKYEKCTPPAYYSSKDQYYTLMEKIGKRKLRQLQKEKKLPKCYLKLLDDFDYVNDQIDKFDINNDEAEDIDIDALFDRQQDMFVRKLAMEEVILDPYVCWDAIKHNIETYYLSGGCHTYGARFNLALAQLVEPNEKWHVRRGKKLTTVINNDDTKIFDLLYWCAINNRLNHHLFGDALAADDPTLGGKDAFLDSFVPINFDFGTYWKEKIIQHLEHPSILKAIRHGIRGYGGKDVKYKNKTRPSSYSKSDYNIEIQAELEDKIFEKLKSEGKIPAEYFKLEKRIELLEKQGKNCLKLYTKFDDMRDQLTESYFDWNNVKHNIESYLIPESECEFNSKFCLSLAQLVEPDEKWYIKFGETRSTVVNEKGTKFFDLAYWCMTNNRLENYLFGQKLKFDEPTFGGLAISMDFD